MTTERKHELEENELSDWLTTFINDIKPYTKLIAAVAVLLAVGLFLFSFGAARRRTNQSLAWTDLFAIQVEADSTPSEEAKSEYVDRLVKLAEREKGSPVGAWALQYAGDISLALGSDKLWEDRAEATARFKSAASNYDSALARADHDILKQRALMGLAQANESLNDFGAAESQYQSIIDTWPGTSVAASASDRLTFLQQPSTREFYDWFLKQDPPKPEQPAVIPGVPGVIPSSNPFSVSPPQSSSVTPGTGLGDFGLSEPATGTVPGETVDLGTTDASADLESATTDSESAENATSDTKLDQPSEGNDESSDKDSDKSGAE